MSLINSRIDRDLELGVTPALQQRSGFLADTARSVAYLVSAPFICVISTIGTTASMIVVGFARVGAEMDDKRTLTTFTNPRSGETTRIVQTFRRTSEEKQRGQEAVDATLEKIPGQIFDLNAQHYSYMHPFQSSSTR